MAICGIGHCVSPSDHASLLIYAEIMKVAGFAGNPSGIAHSHKVAVDALFAMPCAR